MKRIESWSHLEEFGIVCLTGESCGYMLRLLCDVTARGKRIIEQCLDCDLVLHENWNSGTKDDPHLGSIMLAPQMFVPMAAFALLDAGYREVWILKHLAVIGFSEEDTDDQVATMKDVHRGSIDRVLRSTATPRNVHQMTGRTV